LPLELSHRTWRTFEQNPQPPPEVKKATALVVAGNPEQGAGIVMAAGNGHPKR